jgi:hypothetical protein
MMTACRARIAMREGIPSLVDDAFCHVLDDG